MEDANEETPTIGIAMDNESLDKAGERFKAYTGSETYQNSKALRPRVVAAGLDIVESAFTSSLNELKIIRRVRDKLNNEVAEELENDDLSNNGLGAAVTSAGLIGTEDALQAKAIYALMAIGRMDPLIYADGMTKLQRVIAAGSSN